MYNLILPFLFVACIDYVCSLKVDKFDLLMPDVWPHRDSVTQYDVDNRHQSSANKGVMIFLTRIIVCSEHFLDKDMYVTSKGRRRLLKTASPSVVDELYLCTSVRISQRNNYYIVGFEPNVTMHTAHHLMLYGCTEPGTEEPVWSCNEMPTTKVVDNKYKSASSCKSGAQVIYAWARNAPGLDLPNDVGFHIGKDSPVKYLVLQIHYMHRFAQDKTDNSGVFLKYTMKTMPRQAGVVLLATLGELAPYKVEYMESVCDINEDKVLHPFAFRVHTHGLGKVVSGYVVKKDETGKDNWYLIGKKSPLLPQMFYPVESTAPLIRNGDTLASRCTMNNTRDHIVRAGETNQDEMCSFFVMYWVERDTPLKRKICYTPGPPTYYWTKPREVFNNIPHVEASTL